ncbi:hypothetical protein QUB33_29060 [Microcoleus sp. B3-A4]|uniref:hypothetical protein n=1 Tax=Microcoleus sp. B3-A4 TaxID=2818653 RepID=UPI002FD73D3B
MNVEPPEMLAIIESIVYKSNGFAIEKLEIVLKKSECLRIAYEMKEEFREIY